MTSGFRGLYRSVLFRSKCFEIFLLSLCYRFLVWFNCGQRTQLVWFQFCLSCWDLFYGLTYLSWCMFCEHLRRMYYMLYCFVWHVLLLSDPVDWWYCSSRLYPCWFSVWFLHQMLSWGVEVSKCIHGFIYFSSHFYQFLLPIFLLFYVYTVKISMFSW